MDREKCSRRRRMRISETMSEKKLTVGTFVVWRGRGRVGLTRSGRGRRGMWQDLPRRTRRRHNECHVIF